MQSADDDLDNVKPSSSDTPEFTASAILFIAAMINFSAAQSRLDRLAHWLPALLHESLFRSPVWMDLYVGKLVCSLAKILTLALQDVFTISSHWLSNFSHVLKTNLAPGERYSPDHGCGYWCMSLIHCLIFVLKISILHRQCHWRQVSSVSFQPSAS